MLVSVSEEVLNLAELFDKNKTTLYLVGGYVRAAFMGMGRDDDVDFASSMPPEKVIAMLKKTPFSVRYKNQLTGVLEIEINGKKYEHATFRTEDYAVHGEHMPCEVKFIDSLEQDAKRRDFTISSIYYDVLTGEVVDPFGGVEDIKKKQIRAVGRPDVLFKNDAERILRLVRHACECGFNIEPKTMLAAKKNVFRLKFLSKTRMLKELKRMLTADLKYPGLGLRAAHVRAFNILHELGALQYLLPQLYKTIDENPHFKNGQSVYEHICALIKFCPPEIRLPAILSLTGVEEMAKNGKIKMGYETQAHMIAKEAAANLTKKEQELVKLFALYHPVAAREKLTLPKARLLVLELNYQQELEQYLLAVASSYRMQKLQVAKSSQNLHIAAAQAKNELYAVSVKQLTVTFDELQAALNKEPKEVKEIQNKLLLYAARRGKLLTKEQNLRLAKRLK